MNTIRPARRHRSRRHTGILAMSIVMTLGVLVAIPLLAQAKDSINYTIVFGHTDGTTTTITGVGTENNVFIANAGGTDKDNPVGMTMHLSCSDKFPGGWGEKEGPDPTADSEWRVLSYFIQKGSKTCGTPAPPPEPAIHLEKATNGEDADDPTGPKILVGDEVEWTFVVTNTGDVALDDITLVDSETIPNAGSPAAISCPKDSLAPGASMTCTAKGTAIEGQYGNLAKVTGTARISSGTAGAPPGVTADGKYAVVTFYDAATGDRTTRTITVTKNDMYVPDAGGTSQSNPIGMTMHLSCSDKFLGGWGQKQGPDASRDSAWQVEAYWIFELKKGEVKTKCGQPIPIEKVVMDTDPSHYFGVPGDPAVDLEKHTNGEDADLPPGPTVNPGDTVTWEYIVTNTGSLDLFDLRVSDDKEGYIGTIPFLAVGDTETLVHTGIAKPGQYRNEGCVVGKTEQGAKVEDCDPSHYDPPAGEGPDIDLEKATNGEDADRVTGPQIAVGDTVTWTYVITNTGDQTLWGVYLYDEQEGRVSCPARSLKVGASMTCTLTGIARPGQYANQAWVTAWGSNSQVSDNDPSHYLGVLEEASGPAIDLEKATNGEDADRVTGPQIAVGDTVTWTYVITNTGNETLWGVYLYDEQEGRVSCPARSLKVGDSMTCTLTGIARLGQYANQAWVTAWGSLEQVSDDDPSHYLGVAEE